MKRNSSVYSLVVLLSLVLTACIPSGPQVIEPIQLPDPALRADAEVYAEQNNITVEEAMRRLEAQGEIGELQAELAEKEADTFGGLWIEHQPEYRVVVAFTENGEDTLWQYLYLDGNSWADLVEVQTVTYSHRELEAAQQQAHQIAQDLGVPVSSGIYVQENRVLMTVGNPDLFLEEVQNAGLALPEAVAVEATDPENLTDTLRGEVLTYPRQDGGTIYFPKQAPTNISMAALMEAPLVLDENGCLRAGTGAGHLILWRNEFTLQVEGETIQVVDGSGKAIAQVGDTVSMGGGESPVADIPGMPLADCPGPYWVMGDIEVIDSPERGQPTSTPAAALESFELLGQAGGNLTAVALYERWAYLAVGPRLVVLDVSDPQGPLEVFRSDAHFSTASDLALSGDRLYWLSDSGWLLVFDVAIPDNPALLATLEIPPGGQAMAIQGRWMYIAEGYSTSGVSENALRVYNISNSLEPAAVSELALPNQAVGMTLADDRLYVSLGDGSLVSANIDNPLHPAVLNILRGARGMALQLPYLFAAEENLTIYQLSEDDQFQTIVRWPIEQEPRLNAIFAAAAFQDHVYLFDSSTFPCGGDVSQSCPTSFHILDFSDPEEPLSLSGPEANLEFDHVEWAQVQGERLYVRDYHGLAALSLEDPAQPTLLWRYAIPSTVMEAYDLTPGLGFVYLGMNLRQRSLYVYDLSDLAEPQVYGPSEPSTATSGALSGNTLFLSLGPDGLGVVDVSEPDTPQGIARLEGDVLPLSGDRTRPVAVVNGTLYASLDPSGLGIVEVSDPERPQVTGSFDLAGGARDLVARDEYLYALTGSGLQVLDVSNPRSPEIIGSLELPGGWQLAVLDDLAFISSRTCLNPYQTGGLAVVGLEVPDNPTLLSTPVDVPCGMFDVAAVDGVAVLAAGEAGVLGVDVSDPAAPYLAYRFDTPYLVTRVAVDGERIYALDEKAGIYVLGK